MNIVRNLCYNKKNLFKGKTMFVDKNDENDDSNYDQASKLKSLAYSNYNKVDKSLKQDMLKALIFAKEKFNSIDGPLKDTEYEMNIVTGFDNMMVCMVSTPDDSFIHYGQRRDDGAESVIMAVCEYLLGYHNPNMRD